MKPMASAVVVFTRDLRVRDHPALAAARAAAERVVPLFVFDDAILGRPETGPNRVQSLLDALHDLDDSLRRRGGALVVRRGDWVREVLRTAREHDAGEIHLSGDVSGYARARLARLERAALHERRAVIAHPGLFVVEPGRVRPQDRDHFSVFTPYHRHWCDAPRRAPAATPRRVVLPDRTRRGRIPRLADLTRGRPAPERQPGGERDARRRWRAWLRRDLRAYGEERDALGDPATSHISAALHLGYLSALEVATEADGHPGAEPFLRQVCWRDFFAQVLAGRPGAAWSDLQARRRPWRDDPDAFAAWCGGRTGYPLVDAAMHQLEREGFVHNRARMVAASFLTKDLGLDWRLGARHYLTRLADGDLASNNLSWQWVAGTGTGANPSRVLNPTVQARRFDPDGRYVRRYVPELARVPGAQILEPGPECRAATGYPAPIVDHERLAARLRRPARPARQDRRTAP
jgi:deoxyribodipyrimidine photo-lyase